MKAFTIVSFLVIPAVGCVDGAMSSPDDGSTSYDQQAISGGPYTFAGLADWDRDSNRDIIARENATGHLWLYPGQSVRGYSSAPRVQIGNGWNPYTFAGLADWDGDGHQDIVTRNEATGKLWLYPGQSVRSFSSAASVEIGNGWSGYTFAGVADWDRDGNQDIVTREDATGKLYLYPGQSVRGYSSATRVEIGNGWNGYTFAGVADWDRDGNQDIITREDATGKLYLYPGQSVRNYSSAARVEIGNGWNGYTFAGVTDWDRDGNQDIVARDTTGLLWLYPGQSVRGYSGAARVQIGNGW